MKAPVWLRVGVIVGAIGSLCAITNEVLINRLQKQAVQEVKSTAKFLSPTEYKGPGGKYRWIAKNDESEAPAGEGLAGYSKVTIKDMADWDDLTGIKADSQRQGIEKKWFQLTGRVVLVKCEEDGDLHIQLADPRWNPGAGIQVAAIDPIMVVCEVPVGKPWDKIREEVVGWAKVKFPCEPHELKLTKYPVITVTGKAFWDGEHHSTKTPNRRNYDRNMTVWEIHPCMKLEVQKNP